MTVGERDILIDPVLDPDKQQIFVINGERRETSWAAVAEETGGEAGFLFGDFLEQGGGKITISASPQKVVIDYEGAGENGDSGEPPLRIEAGTLPSPFGGIGVVHIETKRRDDRPLFVYCGGSGFEVRTQGLLAALKLLRFGDMMLFDYPGYGKSEGPRSLAAMTAATQALAEPLSEEARPVVLWGHSLGGFACSEIAARMEVAPAGVVLETTARNARSALAYLVPGPARRLSLVRLEDEIEAFDVVESLRGVEAPVLVLGAGRDEILDVRNARALAADLKAAGIDARYAEFAEAGHGTVASAPQFAGAVGEFLRGSGKGD
ncbi:alpha/beta fold hydrolase [Parvularcula oceani]|uniref:alpha/beta fold hydrolase n=1 Tax=Parvularcula oceani TaxID=1247963 RepID=UPI00138DDBD1|nr:alpha/beta hydrolase [Parvularcula oceani]